MKMSNGRVLFWESTPKLATADEEKLQSEKFKTNKFKKRYP